ncbi:hypothetical protein AB5I41_20345 [Sphingomonas sp. MMS24-JH45]
MPSSAHGAISARCWWRRAACRDHADARPAHAGRARLRRHRLQPRPHRHPRPRPARDGERVARRDALARHRRAPGGEQLCADRMYQLSRDTYVSLAAWSTIAGSRARGGCSAWR